MANYFLLTLNTTGVANPSLSIESGATYTSNQLVNLTIGTTESPTTGYQMKIWCPQIDKTYDTNIQDTENNSQWITYQTSKQIKFTVTNETKTVYLKLRDDVYNESSQITASITLDTQVPAITINSVDITRISKKSGKNIATFSFSVDSIFTEYKIKVVTGINATQDTGVQIGTTNGSTNMTGTGTFAANTPITCTINGADLELASSGDGQKTIKVFAKDNSNQWSI